MRPRGIDQTHDEGHDTPFVSLDASNAHDFRSPERTADELVGQGIYREAESDRGELVGVLIAAAVELGRRVAQVRESRLH